MCAVIHDLQCRFDCCALFYLLFSLPVVKEVARFDIAMYDRHGVNASQSDEKSTHVVTHFGDTHITNIVLNNRIQT